MNRPLFRIAVGGEERLRKATETRIRAKYERELGIAADNQRRAAIEEKIERELKKEMKRIASPYSLWASH